MRASNVLQMSPNHCCDSGVNPSAIQHMVMGHAYDLPDDEMNIRNWCKQRGQPRERLGGVPGVAMKRAGDHEIGH